MTAATSQSATCARCDAPDLEPTLRAALVEYADAKDAIKQTFDATLLYQECDPDTGKFLRWTDESAQRQWHAAVKRETLALDALLSHARAVRAAKGGV